VGIGLWRGGRERGRIEGLGWCKGYAGMGGRRKGVERGGGKVLGSVCYL